MLRLTGLVDGSWTQAAEQFARRQEELKQEMAVQVAEARAAMEKDVARLVSLPFFFLIQLLGPY